MSAVDGSRMQWPELAWNDWADTAETLHMWTQIVGKTRLALTPLQNHWWNVPLYVTARGLGTSAMDYEDDVLDIEFDFVAHELHLRMSSGTNQTMKLKPRSVADFYAEYLGCLKELGVTVKIDPMPCELATPIRFDLDTEHASYDPEYAHRFWQVLAHAGKVFRAWGTGFLGKVSPVHFFWGSFDLAVTRFSGRTAPTRPGADSIQREAYSHEVISAGFWPGNGGYGAAAFYCYAAPVPDGLTDAKIRPDGAGWDKALGEFVFKYDVVRALASPEKAVMDFLESSYGAAADVARWDRAALERR
ncbi:DUF5996 family protein [Tunturibacter empetritectus]|uniref:Ava_C0101 and related proteins n=1 Tax=Tunturiibacter lichenicola TaxID=2051959 RepID=A0A7W8JBA3_9BACT|nr:DUF5996 family protein [Edaphobacter lichenicola]MBB5346103.1 hypothetical protein [Edaphobacter lichenicola]